MRRSWLLPKKRFFRVFLDWVMEKRDRPLQGTLVDYDKRPFIHIPSLGSGDEAAKEKALVMLALAAEHTVASLDSLEAMLNKTGIKMTIFSSLTQSQGRRSRRVLPTAVPTVRGYEDYPAAAMLIAFITPTGAHSTLVDHISRCQWCADFFLLPTTRPSRFCSNTCRWDYDNDRRRVT